MVRMLKMEIDQYNIVQLLKALQWKYHKTGDGEMATG